VSRSKHSDIARSPCAISDGQRSDLHRCHYDGQLSAFALVGGLKISSDGPKRDPWQGLTTNRSMASN
jgi:hypothetical protein